MWRYFSSKYQKLCNVFNGPFPASFSFHIFNTVQFPAKKFLFEFADDWIRTVDLWRMKQPLCQLSHNDCPKNLFFFFLFQDLPEPQTTSTVGRFSGLVSGPRGHPQCRGLLRKEQPVENGKVGKQNLGQGCRDSDLSLREGKLGYHQHFYKGKILGCFIKLPLTRLYL